MLFLKNCRKIFTNCILFLDVFYFDLLEEEEEQSRMEVQENLD